MAPKSENNAFTSDNPKDNNADNPIAALHAHVLHIAQITTDTNVKLDQLIKLMTDQRDQPHHRRRCRPHHTLRIITSDHQKFSSPLDWNKYLANNRILDTWQEFSRALELRFGPSTYENHQATLFKLHQTSTISTYQSEFEKLSNRVTGLGIEALLNCFLSGFRSGIQNELALLHPTSLHQAYGLAKLVEDKLHASLQHPTSASSILMVSRTLLLRTHLCWLPCSHYPIPPDQES